MLFRSILRAQLPEVHWCPLFAKDTRVPLRLRRFSRLDRQLRSRSNSVLGELVLATCGVGSDDEGGSGGRGDGKGFKRESEVLVNADSCALGGDGGEEGGGESDCSCTESSCGGGAEGCKANQRAVLRASQSRRCFVAAGPRSSENAWISAPPMLGGKTTWLFTDWRLTCSGYQAKGKLARALVRTWSRRNTPLLILSVDVDLGKRKGG